MASLQSCLKRTTGPRVASRRSRSACTTSAKLTLYDAPLSNFSARVRYVIRRKGLEGEVDIVSPQTLGGLKSPEYLRINPQGKMPVLVLDDGHTSLPESEVIVQYLMDRFADRGPSLRPSTPELRAKAALATRVHDVYLGPIQACMYRAMDPETRSKQLGEIAFQLNVLEDIVQGPYVAGSELSTADAALFPTFVFYELMLPSVFGWQDVFAGRPKLRAWWEAMKQDPVAAKVMEEVRGGLQGWVDKDRWTELGIRQQVAGSKYKWAY